MKLALKFFSLVIIIMIIVTPMLAAPAVTHVPLTLPGGWSQGYATGMWGSGPNDIYSVGFGQSGSAILPVLYHYNGANWSSISPALPVGWGVGAILGAWGSSATDVHFAGYGFDGSLYTPLIYNFDGVTWSYETPALPVGWSEGYLAGMWGTASNNIYASGYGNDGLGSYYDPLLYHYDGSAWSVITPSLPIGWSEGYLLGIWGSAANNIYAMGYGFDGSLWMPLIYHFDGSSWSSITPTVPGGWTSGYLYTAWGSSANNIYAVGYGDDGSGYLKPLVIHYDGNNWISSTVTLPGGWSSGRFWGAWGVNANDIYAVGLGINGGSPIPLIYHYDGNSWTPMPPSLPAGYSEGYLWGVWGSGGNDIYTSGYGFDGSRMKPLLYHIADTTPPVITVPGNITAEAAGPSGAVVTFSVSATDENAPANPAVTCAPASGSTFSLGVTPVTCSATDIVGNTGYSYFNVIVQDTTPPNLSLPSDMTLEGNTLGGRNVSFSATATDLVDGAVAVVCNPVSGSFFPVDVTTTVNCSATDAHNNAANGSFTVTIADTTPPTLNLPGNITVPQTTPAGAVVSWSATATDLVDGSLPVTCVPPSGSTFLVGTTTTVNCSATDAHGNTANGSFTVTVTSANLLLNPNFDTFASIPKAWTYSVMSIPVTSLLDCATYLSPGCSLKLAASRAVSIVTQTVSYTGAAGNQFSYGLFSSANNVPMAGTYKVEVALFDRFSRAMLTQFLNFTNGTHSWEMQSGQFAAPGAFTKIRFRFYFQKSVGWAWFDNAFLYRLP